MGNSFQHLAKSARNGLAANELDGLSRTIHLPASSGRRTLATNEILYHNGLAATRLAGKMEAQAESARGRS
jgi:hypothetical protein